MEVLSKIQLLIISIRSIYLTNIFCTGVVKAVGTEIFNQRVTLTLKSTETQDLGQGRSQEHAVFTVHFLDDQGEQDDKKVTK